MRTNTNEVSLQIEDNKKFNRESENSIPTPESKSYFDSNVMYFIFFANVLYI